MKTMFKTISAAALALSLAGVASAESDSATVTLGSNTGAECDVDAVATGLNITIGLDQTVADVTIECNHYGNVTIDVSSDDDDAFILKGQGPDLPYTIDYILGDASPNPFVAAILELTEVDNETGPFSVVVDNTGGAFLEPVQYEVRVNVDAQDVGQTFAGSRSDDVTISISTS